MKLFLLLLLIIISIFFGADIVGLRMQKRTLASQSAVFDHLPSRAEEKTGFGKLKQFDIASMKRNWRMRINKIENLGLVPIIDVLSSFSFKKIDIEKNAEIFDKNGLAIMALTNPNLEKMAKPLFKLLKKDSLRYFPALTGDGGGIILKTN